MFFSTSRLDLEYVSSLVGDLSHGESYWIGIDDRDKNGTWTTSLGVKHSKLSPFFVGGDAGTNPCGYVKSNSGGFASSTDCNIKHLYVCETQQLGEAPDYPCPDRYIPYKDKCLMPNPQRKTFESAQIFCASRGGIILPIRDEGTLEFVQAWGPRSVRNDVWVGLRKKKYTRLYDPSLEKPLQETITEGLTYSDGEGFDVDNDYKICLLNTSDAPDDMQ